MPVADRLGAVDDRVRETVSRETDSDVDSDGDLAEGEDDIDVVLVADVVGDADGDVESVAWLDVTDCDAVGAEIDVDGNERETLGVSRRVTDASALRKRPAASMMEAHVATTGSRNSMGHV